MAPAGQLDAAAEARFFAGVRFTAEFFMGMSAVHRSLAKLAKLLDEAAIPYAIVGAMALNEYGFRRATTGVDILLTRAGLEAFKARWLGRGYAEKFAGSEGMRDTENEVSIDVRLAGDYPGDGKPKAIAFPDPATAALVGARVRLLPLERFVELELASGMTAAHRLQDLVDVMRLVQECGLGVELAEQLDPSVRTKYRELWQAAQTRDPE